jgi:BirA family biotin operon repressor/biotin-[acetyl-CoA-carboxylase] ligase
MTKAALIERVFAKLTDGEFHSGQELARGLGVTRSAVWKAAGSLRELGMPLEAIRNRGYRLAVATEPLDAVRIRSALPREILTRVRKLEVEWSVDSTNTQLVAEMPRDVGALSLAIGVCMLRALKSAGVADVRLKWPNDVLVGDRKLGGILIELRAESAGPVSVVVGIGLNVALGDELLEKIATTGLYATDLHSAIADGADAPRGSGSHPTLSRNAVAAAVIEQCIRGLAEFEREGLRPFVEEWRRADALRGRDVTVHSAEVGARGLARGIDLSGALLVETPHGLRKFIGGEVTVRPET